jgi:hypothetical protein
MSPIGDDEITPGRVRIVRNSIGKFIGFQDPDEGGRFISRQAALGRLTYNDTQSMLEDSFGQYAGVGAIGLPGRGVSVGYTKKAATYNPLGVDPLRFTPASNQEVIERVVFVNKEGKLITLETSYGLGKRYSSNKSGGRWRQAATEALGVKEGERLPTADLQRAVVYKEYIIKTIS